MAIDDTRRIVVLSDPHFACDIEAQRGDYEIQPIRSLCLRLFVQGYRRYIWNRYPFAARQRVLRALEGVRAGDGLVVNGDFTVDSEFVGVSDPGSEQSVRQCLDLICRSGADWIRTVIGDHDLGKKSLFGEKGGMRIQSLRILTNQLGFSRSWSMEVGKYTLIGVTSSLLALPVYSADILPIEQAEWEQAREEHLDEIHSILSGGLPGQKRILFCHDPTALPYLAADERIQPYLKTIELTVLGHLHSPAIFKLSRRLAGMPEISFLGLTARRMSRALRQARHWEAFRPVLCPALAGIECMKDGGYLTLELDLNGKIPPVIRQIPLPSVTLKESSI